MTLKSNDLENLLAAATPGGIEAQEARGQTMFVASDVLPKECPREELEALGFKFGKDQDDIFIDVKFPEGWGKSGTDHSMWSDLLDGKDRIRGNIFYKAAFYDRSAHMNLCRFLNFTQIYDHHDDYIEGAVQFAVKSGDGETIFKTNPIMVDDNSAEYWDAQDKGSEEVKNWLNTNYPAWDNPKAYWDHPNAFGD